MGLQEHPTHPLIPTQRYVRPNLKYGDGFIGSTHLYKQYPFKKTNSGRRSAIVQTKELTDFEYSLTQGEWSSIIKAYGKYLLLYLQHGYTYKFPYWRLGELKFAKLKRRTPDVLLMRDTKHLNLDKVLLKQYYHTMGYKLHMIWTNKRFRFQKLWGLSFPQMYKEFSKNAQLIHRISDK